MDPDIITECAKAIYQQFARVDDPAILDRRWSRLPPAVRDCFFNEAQAAIRTFISLSRGSNG